MVGHWEIVELRSLPDLLVLSCGQNVTRTANVSAVTFNSVEPLIGYWA
jgi:hypothetical protein